MMNAPNHPPSRGPRGVTLLEGLISTVILLTGMIGVLQGVAVASQQNAIANRHLRATIIAHELMTAIEQQGRARLLASGSGLFVSPQCGTHASLPPAVQTYVGDLYPTPASFGTGTLNLSWGASTQSCYINFDGLGAAYRAMTPGYTTQDDTTYTRTVAVFSHATDPEVMYVGVTVGWRDAGRDRVVKRVTALYDTTTNQTNLEF
jgi:type II secretory pathway pseudopilin PulG